MAISDLFKNNFETRDVTQDPRLRCHYYGNDYQTCQNAISSAMSGIGYKVMGVNEKYLEMLFESKKAQAIITLTKVSLYETRVDIKLNTHYLIPLGRGLKHIEEIYANIDRRLTLKYKGGKGE